MNHSQLFGDQSDNLFFALLRPNRRQRSIAAGVVCYDSTAEQIVFFISLRLTRHKISDRVSERACAASCTN